MIGVLYGFCPGYIDGSCPVSACFRAHMYKEGARAMVSGHITIIE